MACLEAGTLLVIDDAESCPFAPVVAELVRYAADAVDPGKRLVVVLATASPESVLAELNVPAGCFRRRALDGLDRATLTEMARDYFAVEDVPVSVLDLIEESSSGEPGALREVLGRLEAAGMAVDFLGELQVPEGLPRAIDVRGSTGGPAEL